MNTSRRSFFKFLAGAILAPTLPMPKPRWVAVYNDAYVEALTAAPFDFSKFASLAYAIKRDRERNGTADMIDMVCDRETAAMIQKAFYARGNSAHPS